MRLFISYATKDGLQYARSARQIIKQAGHNAWMWDHDKTQGALTWREISTHILNSDAVLYLCTISSKDSWGQGTESGIALNNRKTVLAIRLDDASVPQELTARNYESWGGKGFETSCGNLASQLPQVVERIQQTDAVTATNQLSSATRSKRLRYITQLNTRTATLDPTRVKESRDEIMHSYLEATVPRRVARISRDVAPNHSRFWTIELWSMVTLDSFNSPSFWWGPYFSDTGRAFAAGEQAFLQEAIQKQIDADSETISHAEPNFDLLERRVQALSEGELPPDTLLAPIEVYVPFVRAYYRQMAWKDPLKVTVAGTQLNISGHIDTHRLPVSWHCLPREVLGMWSPIKEQGTPLQ